MTKTKDTVVEKISDYDLKYKYNLNLTQRVLYRFFLKLGKNPHPTGKKLKVNKGGQHKCRQLDNS